MWWQKIEHGINWPQGTQVQCRSITIPKKHW